MAIKTNLGFGNSITHLDSYKLSQINNNITNRCIMCRDLLNEETKTIEHIFPRWLQKKYNLRDKSIILPNKSTLLYRQFTIPCCKECNSGPMSEWEKAIQCATEKGYDEFIKLDEEIILWWLLKIYYSKLIKEHFLKEDVKKPSSRMMISKEQLLAYDAIYLYMTELLKGAKFNIPKPYEIYLFRTENNGTFDYIDDILRHVMYMHMDDILIVCSIDSFSLFSIQYEEELKTLKKLKLVNPLQAIELFTKMTYYKSHYGFDNEHRTIIKPTGIEIDSEIFNVKQIREFNLFELYNMLSEIFRMKYLTIEIPPFKEGMMFSTILKE